MDRFLAYIPVINKQYFEWLNSKADSVPIQIIPKNIIEQLLPRLSRNIISLDDNIMVSILRRLFPGRTVEIFEPNNISKAHNYYLPDEDLSHLLVNKYFSGDMRKVVNFEAIHARYDMQKVKSSQPVIPDCTVSSRDTDLIRIAKAETMSNRSPDWWRQIGVLIFKNDLLLVSAWNRHYPTEYEPAIFGDMRLNFDAGDSTAKDFYSSLHAERVAIAMCARLGISTEGASVYINTFPCGDCARWLVEAGISKLYFREGSSFLSGFDVLRAGGIQIIKIEDPD